MPNPLLLSSLSKYFKENPKESRLLQSLVNGTYPVSLRVMDWFITHYSKMKNVLYWIDDQTHTMQETVPSVIHSGIRKFHLYYEYRAQLKSYTKLCFDPFRRHDRISFVIQSDSQKDGIPETIETTVGQLNFFRWAIQNHILDYIQNHRADIEESMVAYQNLRRKRDTTHPEDSSVAGTDAGTGTGAGAEAVKKKAKVVSQKKKINEPTKRDYSIRFD
jgi:hypothetical protein